VVVLSSGNICGRCEPAASQIAVTRGPGGGLFLDQAVSKVVDVAISITTTSTFDGPGRSVPRFELTANGDFKIASPISPSRCAAA
jgi:hypothetical protein